MIRTLLQKPLCGILRLFFRRIEVRGRDLVPAGPVLFILNHPNALIDPLVLLCRAGRPVSFLAKEPLFRMPVIGLLVRAMDSIPVYRRMDEADTSRNAATFAAARELLGRGGSLALFPEGTSHSDPRLKPFRTGAARIALGAGVEGLQVVPAGLYYTEKSRFRSRVLLCFGAGVPVTPAPVGPDGEPSAEAVRLLTGRLEEALRRLTLDADHHEALRLAGHAERIFTSAGGTPADLAERVELRRRLLAGYVRLRDQAPERLAAVVARITRYQAVLDEADLTPELLPATGYRTWAVLRVAGRGVGVLLVLLPLAVVGIIVHLPAWLAIDAIARRYQRSNLDMVSTVKALGGLVFYPVTWLLLAWLAGRWLGGSGVLVTLALAPLAGLAAVWFVERFDRLAGGARGLLLALTGRRRFLRLVAERKVIREELVRLGEEFGV